MSAALAERLDARPKRQPRPRRKKPIPRAAYRRANSPRPPAAVELFFAAALQRMAARFAASVWRVVGPRISDFARNEPGEEPKEEGDNDAAARSLLSSAAKGSLQEGAIVASANEAAKRTNLHSQQEFKRLGIRLGVRAEGANLDAKSKRPKGKAGRLAVDLRKEPTMTPLIDGWRKDTVARITGMQDDQLAKVDKVLREGFGRHVESMAKDIKRQLGDVTSSRAELIARDQILTLHSKITHHRQKAAGIDEYVWTTSNDERVRDEHEELEGETFSWDEGGDPEEGHPGEAVNCRCVAFPVLDELDDDEDDD